MSEIRNRSLAIRLEEMPELGDGSPLGSDIATGSVTGFGWVLREHEDAHGFARVQLRIIRRNPDNYRDERIEDRPQSLPVAIFDVTDLRDCRIAVIALQALIGSEVAR